MYSLRIPRHLYVQHLSDRSSRLHGRIAVSLGIAVFLVTYVFLLDQLGLWAGIAIGWLLSGLTSWASMQIAYRLIQYSMRP